MMVAFELFKCKSCGLELRRKRLAQRYCSERCRNAAAQNRKRRKQARSGDGARSTSPAGPVKKAPATPLLRSGDRRPKITREISNFRGPKIAPIPPDT